jgi:DNA-binding transcriptional MerR regulator
MLISDLARAAGTTTRAVRYYEQHGLIHPRRRANGYRDYDQAAVRRVRNIRWLLSLGFTAGDIQAFLPCLDDDLPAARACPASAAIIAGKLAVLEETISALTDLHRRLSGLLDRIAGQPAGR